MCIYKIPLSFIVSRFGWRFFFGYQFRFGWDTSVCIYFIPSYRIYLDIVRAGYGLGVFGSGEGFFGYRFRFGCDTLVCIYFIPPYRIYLDIVIAGYGFRGFSFGFSRLSVWIWLILQVRIYLISSNMINIYDVFIARIWFRFFGSFFFFLGLFLLIPSVYKYMMF